MREKLVRLNQYWFDVDVFDKYRDAVRKTNRESILVLSFTGIAAAIAMIVFGFLTKQPIQGLAYCIVLLVAGIIGAIVCVRKESSGGGIRAAGYCVTVAMYIIAVYGASSMKTDAFWIGTQVAVGVYMLDYAIRVGVLQILSYVALCISWQSSGVNVDTQRLVFSIIYLLVGLITFYTINRTRATLIMGREESRRAADTDLLTGLTVRIAAQQEIEEHLKTDDHGVLMLLDLDRFKSVNDRLGHQMGDKVLVDVAADLRKMFRNSDVLSRLGGDEFVVYLKSVPEKDWALQRASQVVREVRRWVGDGTTNIQVTASVGIVMTDMVARNYDDLYRAADIAMYTAKADGGNKALFYTKDMLDNRETVEGPVRVEAPGRNGETGPAGR